MRLISKRILQSFCVLFLARVGSPTFAYDPPPEYQPNHAELEVNCYWPILGWYSAAPPYAGCVGGGQYHIRTGDSSMILAWREVKNAAQALLYDMSFHQFLPGGGTNTPNYFYYDTNTPQLIHIPVNFCGIPDSDYADPQPSFQGSMCVVKATVQVPNQIPHGPGQPPVTINYSVLPAGILFDTTIPYPVVIALYDPSDPNRMYLAWLGGQTGNNSFQWNGALYYYDAWGNPVGFAGYCQASTVFAQVALCVEDHQVNLGTMAIDKVPQQFYFNTPAIAIWGDTTGYLGQKKQYTCAVSVQPDGQVTWSGGNDSRTGNPVTGTGTAFATWFFSEGVRQVQAQATFGGQQISQTWSTDIKDIFLYSDGKEYVNLYLPYNPSLGAYASRLIANNHWDTAYVVVDANGDIEKARFNTAWVDRFKGDLAHKAFNLRNCKWEGYPGPYFFTAPWYNSATPNDLVNPLPANANLTMFDWRGFRRGTFTLATYQQYGNTDVKSSNANCHGNSAHCFGAMTLFLADKSAVRAEIERVGGVIGSDISLKPKSEVMQHIQEHGIIFFYRGSNLCHSAYVVSVGEDPSEVVLWACNAGVPSRGTKGGFDEVILQEYFDADPSVTQVSFLNDIHAR